jgi:hypothetical protein
VPRYIYWDAASKQWLISTQVIWPQKWEGLVIKGVDLDSWPGGGIYVFPEMKLYGLGPEGFVNEGGDLDS